MPNRLPFTGLGKFPVGSGFGEGILNQASGAQGAMYSRQMLMSSKPPLTIRF